MQPLKYDPTLNAVTGSVTATLLLLQLEHWFKVTKNKPFYKFLASCEDTHYRLGDSWTEELGFTKPEFRTAFSHIGKVYKSKRAYLESKDKFEGKYYLSYYDRMKKLTYYVRNTTLVDALLGNHESVFRSSKEKTSIQSFNLSSSPKIKDKDCNGPKVLALFKQYCPTLATSAGLTSTCHTRLTQLIDCLQAKGENALVRLQEAFSKVEASDYLCGRLPKSTWRAALSWILKPDKFFAILENAYAPFVPSYATTYDSAHAPLPTDTPTSSSGPLPTFSPASSSFLSSSSPSKAMPGTSKRKPFWTFNRMETHDFNLEELEAKERAHQLKQYASKLHNLSS